MAKQLDRDMAFAAGKLAAEQAFDEDNMTMIGYASEMARVPSEVGNEFKDGWSFAADNIDRGNYTRTNEIGIIRVRNWLEGRHLIEQTPATLIVAPGTVDRVQEWLIEEPRIDMDSVVNVALDCLAHYYDLWFGATKSGDTTEKKVRERFGHAIQGQTYWDTILNEQGGVHRGETS